MKQQLALLIAQFLKETQQERTSDYGDRDAVERPATFQDFIDWLV